MYQTKTLTDDNNTIVYLPTYMIVNNNYYCYNNLNVTTMFQDHG